MLNNLREEIDDNLGKGYFVAIGHVFRAIMNRNEDAEFLRVIRMWRRYKSNKQHVEESYGSADAINEIHATIEQIVDRVIEIEKRPNIDLTDSHVERIFHALADINEDSRFLRVVREWRNVPDSENEYKRVYPVGKQVNDFLDDVIEQCVEIIDYDEDDEDEYTYRTPLIEQYHVKMIFQAIVDINEDGGILNAIRTWRTLGLGNDDRGIR